MRVLVTGGGGFLGQAICQQLMARGDQVVSLSRRDYPALRALGVTTYQGDIADLSAVKAAASRCDAIIHSAAKAGIWGSYEAFYRSNVEGTAQVLRACRELGIAKLVYTSSPSVVFAGQSQCGIDESVTYPRSFLAYYPQTKAIAEQQVMAANDQQLATVSLRPHLIWGPGDNHILPGIKQRALSGRLRLIDGGVARVDNIYIENAAWAHLLALDRLSIAHPISGKTYFLSQDEPLSLHDFTNRLLAACGIAPVTKRVPYRLAYPLACLIEGVAKMKRQVAEPLITRFVVKQLACDHWYDISAAKSDLGYYPRVSTAEGMKQLAQYSNALSV